MDDIESLVMGLELELLQPATRGNAMRLDALLADDFHEVGATGRSFGKAEVLARLPQERGVCFATHSMRAQVIADMVALVSYQAVRSHQGRTSFSERSSLWVLGEAGWRMRHHQGTPADSPGTTSQPDGPSSQGPIT